MAGHQVSAGNFKQTFIPWPNIVLRKALGKKKNCLDMHFSSSPNDLAYTDKGIIL
jgi:hypothetical protein